MWAMAMHVLPSVIASAQPKWSHQRTLRRTKECALNLSRRCCGSGKHRAAATDANLSSTLRAVRAAVSYQIAP